MGCSCHGKNKISAAVTRPLDQCPVCAKKHFDDAFACYHEFLYTDANRDHIHGQLRAVVNHTFRLWPETAKRVRDLAEKILMVRDREITTEWTDLQKEIDSGFYMAFPDAADRLNELKINKKKETANGPLL